MTFCVCAFRTNTEVNIDGQESDKTDNILPYNNQENIGFDNI